MMFIELGTPRDTVPRPGPPDDTTAADALADIRRAIHTLARSRYQRNLSAAVGDAILFLRNAEGRLDRLAGC